MAQMIYLFQELDGKHIEVAKQVRQTVLDRRLGWPSWEWLGGQAWRESTFNPGAFNPDDPHGGSIGLFQFQGGTWEWIRQEMSRLENWRDIKLESYPVGAIDSRQATLAALCYWRLIRKGLVNAWGITPDQIEIWQVLGGYNDGPDDFAKRIGSGMTYMEAKQWIPQQILDYIEGVTQAAHEIVQLDQAA